MMMMMTAGFSSGFPRPSPLQPLFYRFPPSLQRFNAECECGTYSTYSTYGVCSVYGMKHIVYLAPMKTDRKVSITIVIKQVNHFLWPCKLKNLKNRCSVSFF